jgi:hypothetical protein
MPTKSPSDLSAKLRSEKDDVFLREAFVLPRPEARKRAKAMFDEFPSSAYMTEIEVWQDRGAMVEVKMKRLNSPIDD